MTYRHLTPPMATLLASLSLAACDNSGDTGTMTLGVTDAPVDGASEVSVTFTDVTIQQSGNEIHTITFDPPRKVNLLALSGGRSVVLFDAETLPAGDYQWMRLGVNDNPEHTYIIDSMGGQHSLRIPSADRTGLKLHRAFNIESDGNIAFTIDFDLRKSVHMANGQYILRPTLRVVETALAASLSGTVDNTLVTAGCSPGVYLFNEGQPVDDLDGTDDAIFSIALPEAGPYDYSAGFLPPGSYTIAFTCDAGSDANDADDPVSFSRETSITLQAGEQAEFNFTP